MWDFRNTETLEKISVYAARKGIDRPQELNRNEGYKKYIDVLLENKKNIRYHQHV